jgi:hypothetical protein
MRTGLVWRSSSIAEPNGSVRSIDGGITGICRTLIEDERSPR